MALLTDLYQLTMAYGYWKSGLADREAVFHLFFREHPFHGGFTLSCGLGRLRQVPARISLSATTTSLTWRNSGAATTSLCSRSAFLEYLRELRLRFDVDAIPEGSVVFPHEPLLRVRGPLLQAQLVERLCSTSSISNP